MIDDAVELKQVVRRVWTEALPGVPFRDDATWDEIGIDSLPFAAGAGAIHLWRAAAALC